MLRSSHRLYSTLPPNVPVTLHSYPPPPPPPASLDLAHKLFASHHDRHNQQQQAIFTSHLFRTLPESTNSAPEVLLLGRSNVGKSSLLNALLGVPAKRYASESARPGHTRVLQGFAVGQVRAAVERRAGG